MKKTEKKDINWQLIKLIDKGASGLSVKYTYLTEYKGRGVLNTCPFSKDVEPHPSLIDCFNELRPIVSKVENVDYARKLLSLPGFDATETQQQMTEGSVQEAMRAISVTGISISEKKHSG